MVITRGTGKLIFAITSFSIMLIAIVMVLASALSTGAQIAYISGATVDTTHLYLMDVNRRIAINLAPDIFASPFSPPDWSPDGEEIAFVSGRLSNPALASASGQSPDTDLYVVNVGNRAVRRLPDDGTMVSYPTWSPDGKYIAFAMHQPNRQSIALVTSDGGEVRLVADGVGANTPSWSPDGQHIAFTAVSGVQLVNPHTLDFRSLTPPMFPPQSGFTGAVQNLQRPVWSPGGEYVIYAGMNGGQGHIYLAEFNSGSLRRLTELGPDDSQPAWSPDGTRLAFISGPPDRRRIYVIEMSGAASGDAYFVTEGTVPVWFPDGDRLVFIGLDSSIHTVDLNSGKQRRLTSRAQQNYYPTWRPGLD